MLTAEQVRAARSLLRWNQTRLAQVTGLALSTIKRLESQDGALHGNAQNVWKIQATFEDAGIIFLEKDGVGGVGVRLKA